MTKEAYKTILTSLDDLKAQEGKEIGLSEWLVIDQATINQFATLTKDEQWIHTNPAQCAQFSPYKTPIAHGFLVLSFCSHFAEQAFAMEGAKMGVNYGFNKVRFTNAVKVGAKIRGRFQLIDAAIQDNSAKYTMRVTIEIEGETKPACVAEWIGLMYV